MYENFSGKIGKCGLLSTALCSPDGLPKYVTNIASSSSPTCTDERIIATLMDLEDPANPVLTGGVRSFLTGPTIQPPGQQQAPYHDFFTVLILDLGYRSYGRLPVNAISLKQVLDNLVALTGGRFQYRLPPHPLDDWFDEQGNQCPPPAPHPLAPAPAPAARNITMDLQANAGTLATKFRNPSEHNFQFIWACNFFIALFV